MLGLFFFDKMELKDNLYLCMLKGVGVFVAFLMAVGVGFGYSQESDPKDPHDDLQLPTDFKAFDLPNDDGKGIAITWKKLPSEEKIKGLLWAVFIGEGPEGPFKLMKKFPANTHFKSDRSAAKYFRCFEKNKNYHFFEVNILDYYRPTLSEYVTKLQDAISCATFLSTGKPELEKIKEFEDKMMQLIGLREGIVRQIYSRIDKLRESNKNTSFLETSLKRFQEKDIPIEEWVLQDIRDAEAKGNFDNICDRFDTYVKKLKHIVLKDVEDDLEVEEKEITSRPYYFKLSCLVPKKEGEKVEEKVVGIVSGRAEVNWFRWEKINVAVLMILFCGVILFYLSFAKRRQLFLRRIAGLDAVEEAIGRATEMGKPIYYLTGLNDIGDPTTIAATVILGEVAKKTALYDTPFKVPHYNVVVMAVCQEITKQAYVGVGRPDAYNPHSNFYVTDDQFGYAAAVDGMFLREKPAAIFYMGYYYAEALLLAETGASIGAIQIAGTTSDAQLPFFFTSCDYTLIGEELFAASAYLSKEPMLVGALKGQDGGKLLLIIVIPIITALMTVSALKKGNVFWDNLIGYVKSFIEAL